MRHLLPVFIAKKFQEQDYQGDILATTLFIDISGFTLMTETLMKSGEEGAEILSTILNRLFNQLEDVIYTHEGSISTFAGDAFTAIFPISATGDRAEATKESLRKAFWCARKVQSIFKTNYLQNTRLGNFQFSAKIGMACGQVNWGIVGQQNKAYFFRGDAIEWCSDAQTLARTGECIVHQSIVDCTPENFATFHPVGDSFFRLDDIHIANFPVKYTDFDIPNDIASFFLPDSVLHFRQTGEFRNAVSVFISFSGMDTYEQLDRFITIILRYIKQFSGYFNKIDFGDKGGIVLCVFGAPIAYENNVDRSLDFVLSIRNELANEPELSGTSFKIGITYGVVFAGIVGGEKRCEYSVLGDTVNLAARFMSRANTGDIWVSERIYQHSDRGYEFEHLGDYTFKGKTNAIPVYKLLSKKAISSRSYSGMFVGHTTEMNRADRFIQRIRKSDNGKPRFGGILYIIGEAGIGKSRLVYELKKKHYYLNWLPLTCDGILRKPFNPFFQCFSQFFHQSPNNSLDTNRQAFDRIYEGLIEETTDADINAELKRLKSIMAGFLNIHYPNSIYAQLDPKLRYDNTLYAFKEVFKALSLKQPIVLEIDDLHWIDPDSVHALEILCRGIESFPILLIGISRPVREQTLAGDLPPMDAEEIQLGTLNNENIRIFTESRLSGQVSPQLLEMLIARTQGNPFFLEQTLLFFQETGIISPHKKGHKQTWSINRTEADIPATINDLLIARIDRLSDRLKQVIQTAAVIGREFDVKLLSQVMQKIDRRFVFDELHEYLELGEKENIWTLFTELHYIFSHTLLQDAVYRMQLKKRRRELHETVAEQIEQISPGDEEVYADLAFHYEKAEIREQTLKYYRLAADFFKESYKNERGLEFYDKLLELWDETLHFLPLDQAEIEITAENRPQFQTVVDILARKGDLLKLIGLNDEAQLVFEQAYKLSVLLQDEVRIGRINGLLGLIYYSRGEYDQALALLQEQFDISKKHHDKNGMSGAIGYIGGVHLARGQFDKAMDSFKEKLALSEEIDATNEMARALGYIGMIYDMSGDHKQAHDYYDQQLRLCEKLGDKLLIANVNINKGALYQSTGKYNEARSCYQTALDVSNELGYKREISIAIGNLGDVYGELGDYGEAIRCFEQKLRYSEELGDRVETAIAIGNMGAIYLKKGDLTRAGEFLDRAINACHELQIKFYLPYYQLEKVDLLVMQNDLKAAADLNQEALTIAQEMGQSDNVFRSRVVTAKIEHLQGHSATAIAQFKNMQAEVEMPDEQAAVAFELWQISGEDEQRKKAQELYTKLYEETPNFIYKKRITRLENSARDSE